MDESHGFNLTLLQNGLMEVEVKLTDETKELIPTVTNRSIEEVTSFTWNATYFKNNVLLLDIFFV